MSTTVKFEVDVPEDYTCGSGAGEDCFFRIEYAYTSSANDTTRAYVVGNPIHLIGNG